MSTGLPRASALVVAVLVSSVTWADRPINIETAARAYRIRVYASFRQNRAEYDERIERGDEVLSAWRRGGVTPAEEQAVLVWFLKASEASVPGAEMSLPQLAELPALNQRGNQFPHTFIADESNSKPVEQPVENGALATSVGSDTREKSPTPANTVSAVTKFGQMLGNRVSQVLGGSQTDTEPPADEKAAEMTLDTVSVAASETQSGETPVADSEALLALQSENDVEEELNSELGDTIRNLNESIEGHNAIVGSISEQLLSEWDFDPEAAEELVAKLEASTIIEVSLAEQIEMIAPSFHSQISPLESVTSLFGEVDERLQALKDGLADFESTGFDADAVQRLFERLEQLRAQLDY